MRIWNVDTGDLVHTLQAFNSDAAPRVVFTPDNRILFAVGGTGTPDAPEWECRMWDAGAGKLLGVLGQGSGSSSALTVSPDGGTLALGTWEGNVLLYRIAQPSP